VEATHLRSASALLSFLAIPKYADAHLVLAVQRGRALLISQGSGNPMITKVSLIQRLSIIAVSRTLSTRIGKCEYVLWTCPTRQKVSLVVTRASDNDFTLTSF
jgi:hypothetical protein